MAKQVKVYTDSLATAREKNEVEAFKKSRNRNEECTKAIDKAIQESNYEPFHYDLKTAAKSVISEFGELRVNLILANVLNVHKSDARFSHKNREWGRTFDTKMPLDPAFKYCVPNSHSCLVDSFITRAQEVSAEIKAAKKEKKTSITDRLQEKKVEADSRKAERGSTAPKKEGREI